ncbi:MAG: Ig-like domain-containing protein [Clostridia bacterium]|nr:Ig-like domain-containing protein [Clostridia bacterium]
MKTPSVRLAALIIFLLIAILIFAPMRSGVEDYIELNVRSLRMNAGDTYDIDYTLYSRSSQNVMYASSNENVVTVDNMGMVTAHNPGSARIRVIAQNGARTFANVEVAGGETRTMTLNAQSISLERGQISGLKAVFNEGADDTRVVWHSEDEDVATVDAAGRVSGVGGGETRIVATAAGGLTASADVKVFVSGDAVRITPSDITVGVGAKLRMGCYFIPEDTTDEIARWQSSNESVLAVGKDNTIIAKSVGQAVISVFTENGLNGATLIRVEPSANDFELAPSAVTIERHHNLELTPRFIDASGNLTDAYDGHYIEWTSSNPDIASVDENGMVTGISSGVAGITARCDGMSATCFVTVEVLTHDVRLNETVVDLLREQTVTPIQLEVTIDPVDPDDPTITYTTDNPQVAFADENGLVTFTGAYGTAVITARAASGAEASCTFNVLVKLPEERLAW